MLRSSRLLLSVFVVLLFCFILGIPSQSLAAPEVTLRMAGQNPPDHPATIAMNSFAKEVAEKTKGAVEIKVYPSNQLGDYILVYEELVRGTIDMCLMSQPSQFDPRMEIIYVNGMVKGYNEAKKVFNANGWLFKKMEGFNEKLGVKLLSFYSEGMIGIGSVKPLKDPLNPKVDKGVLVRVPNMDVYTLAAKAMGFRTVTIPYADVYQSLQTGVVDGVDGFPCAAAYTMVGDVIKYWYMTNYSIECFNISVGMKTWNKLKPEYQKIIKQAAVRVGDESLVNAKKEDAKFMELMKKKGIKVYTYTEDQLKPIKEACVGVWPELGKRGMTKELMEEMVKELGS